jgi:type I restriction enzyme, S subunit
MGKQLPKSWAWLPIIELLDKNSNGKPFQQGWSPQCENHPADENDWGVLKTTAIQDGKFLDFENKKLPKTIEPRTHLEVVSGDILMTCAGPRNRCGVVCFVRETRTKLLMSGKMYRFRPNRNLLDAKFLEAFIRSHEAQLAIDAMKTGINDSGLNLTHGRFSELKIPFAPLSEQKRIVAKIEELFSELDNGIAALKTAREQLKVYRQAVLKRAFEGKLTAKWREENANKLETPEQLLTRIQQERNIRYQQQLEDWKAAVKEWELLGNKGKKPNKPRKFEPLGEFSLGANISLELPNSWAPVCIGHVYSVYVGSTPSRKESAYWNGDINWVSSGEVAFCEIQETTEKITQLGYENTSTEIHPEGTVLLAMIGEGKTRGQAAILRVPAAHNQNTAAIRVSEINLSSEYLYYFLQYQYEHTRRVGSGNNQKALNKFRVSSIQIPLCALAEQVEVSSRLSEKLSIIENISHEISDALSRSEAFRQSILKKAFSGQLVPQDPNDEPASELLARIKVEKEQQKGSVIKRGCKSQGAVL